MKSVTNWIKNTVQLLKSITYVAKKVFLLM